MELENMRVRFSFASWCPLPLSLSVPPPTFSSYRRSRFLFPRIFDCLCAPAVSPIGFMRVELPRSRTSGCIVRPNDVGSDFLFNGVSYSQLIRGRLLFFSLSLFLLSFRLLNPSYFESKSSAKILYEKYSFSLFSSRCHEFQNDTDCYPDFIGFNGLSSDLLYTLRNFRRKIFLYFSRLGFVLKDLYIQSFLQMRLES